MPQLFLGILLGFTTSTTCPGNAVVTRHGWNQGFRAALTAGFGIVCGYGALFFVALLGLVPLVRSIPAAAVALWFVGAVVFGRLAWSAFAEARRSHRLEPDESAEGRPAGRGRIWVDGLGAGAGNPVNIAWWAGFMGPALAEASSVRIAFPSGILAGSFLWFATLAIALSFLRARFTDRVYRVILYAGALVLTGFCIGFAVSGVYHLAIGRW